MRIKSKISKHVIKTGFGTLKGSTAPGIDFNTYEFKNLNTGKITPEEYFINAYLEELFESKHIQNSTK